MTITLIAATPVKATRRVASMRSVKFRSNQVPTPHAAITTHSKYQTGGYTTDSTNFPLGGSPLLFPVEILLTIVLPLFHRPSSRQPCARNLWALRALFRFHLCDLLDSYDTVRL